MLAFPNCKINLGLRVLKRRDDGYHDIETVFYPIGWCDSLEVLIDAGGTKPFNFTNSGETIAGGLSGNLVYKAWQLINAKTELPPLKVHLHKNIPTGAGLGGGSSDASSMLGLLNKIFDLERDIKELEATALTLGSDCPFFIHNLPMLAEGRGEKLSEINLNLSQYYILVVHPGIHVATAEAYKGVDPKRSGKSISSIVGSPVNTWRGTLNNDFENGVFEKFPAIKKLKEEMYSAGAIYSAMSGSGSAVFGIFDFPPPQKLFAGKYYLQKPRLKIL